ncbi:MAG: DNA polymerase Y family protein [Burkholderiales bacterium]
MPRLPPALWLCLHLPELPLDALGPWPSQLALPALVWARERGGQRVHTANAAACALGVQPGQRLASAQAVAPTALVLARDTGREAEHLQRLALALGAFTPRLAIAAPDLLLDIRASLRLFGGVRPLLRRARALAAAQGPVRVGLAATPLAARLFARQGLHGQRSLHLASTRRRLHALPLIALPGVCTLPAPAGEMLQALGTRTLADLARLPRPGLHRRGAGPWLQALDQASGQQPDLPAWFTPPEHFAVRLELGWRAETAPAIDAAAAPLVQALCGWLERRWQAAQALRLVLKHEHGARRSLPDEVLQLELATPTRDATHLQRLLSERLQRLPLAAPVDALMLQLDAAVPDAGRPTSLLPDDPHAAQADEATLIDRLRARLGPERIQRLVLQDDARPEQAGRAETAQPGATPLPGTAPALPRPGWLLCQPQPLPERDGLPCKGNEPLRLLTPAERIETGWHDGALVRRDYHVALAADGALLWVYLERGHHRTGSSTEPPSWFLHGLFG